MDIFGDLSYQKASLAPIGSPIEEIATMYDTRRKNYDYVVDNTNLVSNALSSLPYNPKDEERVRTARQHFQDTIQGFQVEGDLENRVLDFKGLANDLNTKFGLNAVQQDYQKRQAYVQGLDEQYKKGDISRDKMLRSIAYSDRTNKGVQEDNLGFTANYQGRSVPLNKNFTEAAIKLVDGIKANTATVPDENGDIIRRSADGKGYMNVRTKEDVTEARVISLVRNYLLNDPDFQDTVSDDVFYELDRMLTNPTTGTSRPMTSQDLINIGGPEGANEVAKRYGKASIKELEDSLKEQGVGLEGVYKAIRAEQMASSHIRAAVDKEVYSKVEDQFLTDWMLKDSIEASRKAKEESATANYAVLQPMLTEDVSSLDAYKMNASIYNDAKTAVNDLKKELKTAEAGNDPDAVKRIQDRIDLQEFHVRQSEQIAHETITVSPVIVEAVKDIIKNEGFTSTVFGGSAGLMQPKINGLSISEGEIYNLVGRNVDSKLAVGDLLPYIKINQEEYTMNWALKKAKGDAYATEALKTKGLAAIDEVFDEYNAEDIRRAYPNAVNHSAETLKKYLDRLSTTLETKIENKEITINRESRAIKYPELKPEDRRNSALAQYEYQINHLNDDSTFYKSLMPAGGQASVINAIEDAYDVDDDNNDIIWAEAKVIPQIDSKFDPVTKTYRPMVMLNVPVNIDGKKDKQKVIKVPAFAGSTSMDALYLKGLNQLRNELAGKAASGQLDPQQKELFDAANLNLFNSTKYGLGFDLLNLREAEDEQIVNTPVSNLFEAHIKVYKGSSPQNMSYYLMTGDGKNGTEPLFHVEYPNGQRGQLTGPELRAAGTTVRAIGANSPEDLKLKVANMIFVPDANYKVDLNQTINISPMFGQDIKQDGSVNPVVAADVAPKVEFLKSVFPDLVLTDALRTVDSTTGAKDSPHKDARALDLRLTPNALHITKLPPQALQQFGIKSAKEHNGTHVHIEFL